MVPQIYYADFYGPMGAFRDFALLDSEHGKMAGATVGGDNPRGWTPLSEKDRENYRGWEHKRGKNGNRARQIIHLEKNSETVIAKARESRAGREAWLQAIAEEEYRQEHATELGYGVDITTLKIGDVVESTSGYRDTISAIHLELGIVCGEDGCGLANPKYLKLVNPAS